MIMEAKRPHDLLSSTWRTSKASDIIQSKSKDLRIREAAGISSRLSPKAQEPEAQMSKGRIRWKQKANLLFIFLFYSSL